MTVAATAWLVASVLLIPAILWCYIEMAAGSWTRRGLYLLYGHDLEEYDRRKADPPWQVRVAWWIDRRTALNDTDREQQ